MRTERVRSGPTYNTRTCDRAFASEEALKQHLRDSKIHQTPLDVFFLSLTLLSHRVHRMLTCENTKGGSVATPRRKVPGTDTKMHWIASCVCGFGAENDLAAWHTLCRAIGVKPLPQTYEQCEEVRTRCTRP